MNVGSILPCTYNDVLVVYSFYWWTNDGCNAECVLQLWNKVDTYLLVILYKYLALIAFICLLISQTTASQTLIQQRSNEVPNSRSSQSTESTNRKTSLAWLSSTAGRTPIRLPVTTGSRRRMGRWSRSTQPRRRGTRSRTVVWWSRTLRRQRMTDSTSAEPSTTSVSSSATMPSSAPGVRYPSITIHEYNYSIQLIYDIAHLPRECQAQKCAFTPRRRIYNCNVEHCGGGTCSRSLRGGKSEILTCDRNRTYHWATRPH